MESATSYRRLLYGISLMITSEERRGLVYIRLYKERKKYKDADTLDVLMRLEADGAFSQDNPGGLLAVAKDLKKPEMARKIKQYLKKREKQPCDALSLDAHLPDASTEALRDRLGRVLSLVTILTEQCSRDTNSLGDADAVSRNTVRAAEHAGGALQTVDDLSEALQEVRKELRDCGAAGRDSEAIAPPFQRDRKLLHTELCKYHDEENLCHSPGAAYAC